LKLRQDGRTLLHQPLLIRRIRPIPTARPLELPAAAKIKLAPLRARRLYGQIKAGDSHAVLKWYRALKKVILSLEEQPNRCLSPLSTTGAWFA
jgi:hypothetical protein